MSPSSTNNWTPPDPDVLAAQLERCEILGTLGRGGMGAVYRARQTGLGREVAIKVLPRELSAIPELVQRFEREARAMAGLDHPRIVRVFDVGQTADGHSYIIMEFVAGRHLADVIASGGLPEVECCRVLCEICEALEHAHARGLVHRDIKPSNVLLDTAGHVKLADFGLALPTLTSQEGPASRLTASGSFLGTLEFMAPEQLAGREVDLRADLYATGVLFYELLTGDIPRGSWKPPSSLRPLNPKLDKIVQRLLEPKPEDRFQSATELRAAVQAVMPSTKPSKNFQLMRIAAVLSCVLLVAWMMRQRTESEIPPTALVVTAPAPEPAKKAPPTSAPIEVPTIVPASDTTAPNVEPEMVIAPSPAPSLPAEPTPPNGPLSDLAAGGRILADFTQSAAWTLEGTWTAEVVRWQNNALTLGAIPAGRGAVIWSLKNGEPVDLSAFAKSRWTVEARLTQEPAAVVLLSLVDADGRQRSWRLKPESFFSGRSRRHTHYLPLERADFQNPSEGFGALLEDAGFELSAVVSAKIEPDPQSPPPLDWGWQIERIGL